MNNFKIEIFKESHISKVYGLLTEYFGVNYISLVDLREMINERALQSTSSSYVALCNNELIGFITGYFPKRWDETIFSLKSLKNIDLNTTSYLKIIAVDQNFRDKKVGTQLFEVILNSFKDKNTENIILQVWNESKGNSSFNFFKSKNFKLLNVIEDYWYESSLKEYWICIRCGNPCKCSVSEMVLSF
jgi:ribosomal protein S18 acetylase RimI-like enzyme